MTAKPDKMELPRHIGIIMDGNGRWAEARGLPRTAGHRQGARAVREITRSCRDWGIGYLTLFAFSTENWSRPAEEVEGIMNLLRSYLGEMERHRDENVRTRFIGDRSVLAADIQNQMAQAERVSADFTGLCLNIAINYGGRNELVQAARAIAGRVRLGILEESQIDAAVLESFLYTAGQPDPDLIIRPSGEQRLSNFMLWQAAYAEMVFMDVLWPDFSPDRLKEALDIYAGRSRRFGGL
jgi:undecaprenyl diphosphate synthase